MRSKHIAIAVVVLAVGAAPAVAAQTTALRSVPTGPAAKPAVWTPAPAGGIKWTANGARWAVWIR